MAKENLLSFIAALIKEIGKAKYDEYDDEIFETLKGYSE